jgi:hypothetical protein
VQRQDRAERDSAGNGDGRQDVAAGTRHSFDNQAPGAIPETQMSDRSEILNTEMTPPIWPQPGDKLFRPGYGRTVAHVRSNYEFYAISYKHAADMLVGSVIENDNPADLMFCPIAHMYRHYLELRLKELLISGGRVAYDESKFQSGHDLKRLWSVVRKLIEKAQPDWNRCELDAAESCIAELCQLDADSQSFRYPESIDGRPTLQGLDRVDLVNLRDVINRVGLLLDCSSADFGEILRSEFY